MTRTVQIPDLADQLAEIVADPTAYVRRTREMQRRLIHMTPDVAHCNGCAADRLAGETA